MYEASGQLSTTLSLSLLLTDGRGAREEDEEEAEEEMGRRQGDGSAY